jgi:hypothetical protein
VADDFLPSLGGLRAEILAIESQDLAPLLDLMQFAFEPLIVLLEAVDPEFREVELGTEPEEFLYSAKDGKDRKVFDAPEWLAAMCSHVPNLGEQMVRYYGYYSNVTRGKSKKRAEDNAVPYIIESDRSPAACRKSWARLIQKIYEVDPLICPKCRGTMRIISSIEDQDVIKTILKHLGLWLIRSRPPAKAHAPPAREYTADDACQTAFPDNAAYGDPDYPWETYV